MDPKNYKKVGPQIVIVDFSKIKKTCGKFTWCHFVLFYLLFAANYSPFFHTHLLTRKRTKSFTMSSRAETIAASCRETGKTLCTQGQVFDEL